MTGAWPGDFSRAGFVTGLKQEARIAARLGGLAQAGGGTRDGAHDVAAALAARGAIALVSFGLAGGLDPALQPGAVVVPRRVLVRQSEREFWVETDESLSAAFGGWTADGLLGAAAPVASAAEKRRLHAGTGCAAVDLETGAVAEIAGAHGLPFAAVRAVCDPASLELPPAALAGLSAAGGISVGPVLLSVLRRPGQVPALLRLARCTAAALRALHALARSSAGA